MTPKRSPQVRTPLQRDIEDVSAKNWAEMHAVQDIPFRVGLPFGEANYRLSSLTPIGASRSSSRAWLSGVPGVAVPAEIDVDFSRDRSAPIKTMKIEVREGVPMCTEIRLVARSDGRGLRAADLESIDIAGWVEDILSECTFDIGVDGGLTMRRGSREGRNAIRDAQRVGRRKVTPDLLARAAEVYRDHIDAKPIEAVSDEFGVGYRTAARYVEMCRSDEFRLLPKTHKGKRRA